jgi:hypothetical protein
MCKAFQSFRKLSALLACNGKSNNLRGYVWRRSEKLYAKQHRIVRKCAYCPTSQRIQRYVTALGEKLGVPGQPSKHAVNLLILTAVHCSTLHQLPSQKETQTCSKSRAGGLRADPLGGRRSHTVSPRMWGSASCASFHPLACNLIPCWATSATIRHVARSSYLFLLSFVSPYPGFGTRSTVVVSGRDRALSTVMNSPVLESRPLREVLLSLLMAVSSRCVTHPPESGVLAM